MSKLVGYRAVQKLLKFIVAREFSTPLRG